MSDEETPVRPPGDAVELGEAGVRRGVQVIQTDGMPDGYVPPSASLDPPAARPADAESAPSADD